MFDIYEELEKFIQSLRSSNYDEYAKAIVIARESGAMGSEILGLVSLELKKYPIILKKDDTELRKTAKYLLDEIKKYFESY